MSIYSSRLAPIRRWLCKSNARWKDLLQAGRDRNAIRQQSRARGLALIFLATTLLGHPALAKCHIFHVWHYPKPQRCFTALAPTRLFHVEQIVIPPERIDITIPSMDFVPCPDGDERFQAIAKLHALMDAR